MIIADDFLWLHLPKTGGTSMNRLFRERALAGVSVDTDATSQKHDSIALRESRGPWRAGHRRRFITARPLHRWLISDWQHKRRHMNLPDLPFEPVTRKLVLLNQRTARAIGVTFPPELLRHANRLVG